MTTTAVRACGARFLQCDRHLCLDVTQVSEVAVSDLCSCSCLTFAPVRGCWGQCVECFCHSIFLLHACLWWRALNRVYSWAGSKRGQQHNWRGRLAAALLWGKHHHTPRNQNKDTEGGRNSARIKEIAIFSPPVLFCCNAFDRKHFLNTTGLLSKRFRGKIMELSRSGQRTSSSLVEHSKILCARAKIFFRQCNIVFTEAEWRAPLSQSQSRVSNRCEANFKQNSGKILLFEGFL